MFEIALQGPEGFRRQAFKKQSVIAGSSRSNDLTLRHEHVSRKHARFYVKDGFFVEDLHSKNGTFVNGVRTEGPVLLRSIDDIDIGPFTLTLVPLNPLGEGAGLEAPPAHPAEEQFLAAIRTTPADPRPRVLYSDFLAQQGMELKAEILRLQERLRLFPLSKAGLAEIAALHAQLPESERWWSLVVARAPIEGCAPRINGGCPRTWDLLKPTRETQIRECETCGESVHYVPSIDEARKHVREGRRVAVDPRVARREDDLKVGPPRPRPR